MAVGTIAAKFFRLGFRTQIMLFESAGELAFAALAVSLLPFRLLHRIAVRGKRRGGDGGTGREGHPERATEQETRTTVHAVRWCVNALVRRVRREICLIESLATAAMLRRRGIPYAFHVGMRKDHDGALCAHAWVTFEGDVITGDRRRESEVREFKEFSELRR